jgi:hypothetical protein
MWIQIVRFIALVPLVGAAAWHRWRKRRMEKLGQGWPSIDGCIHYGEVETNPNTNRSLATLTYVYFIEDYRFGTYTQQFKKKSDADDFVRELKDKHVPIRYNPSKPDESVLEDVDVRQLSSSLST